MKLKNKVLSKLFPILILENSYENKSIIDSFLITLCKIIKSLMFGNKENPLIRVYCCESWMILPFNHALPKIKLNFPKYDTALPELCAFLNYHYSAKIKIIDIGANIGDTINQIMVKVSDLSALCIEPSKIYFPLLVENTRKFKDVECFNSFITNDDKTFLKVDEERGTATPNITEPSDKSADSFTLDYLVKSKFSKFKNIDILKIDTDGWDIHVLEGAKNLIINTKPFIFFEFSPFHLFRNASTNTSTILSLFKFYGYFQFILYDGEGFLLGLFDLKKNSDFHILLNIIYNYGCNRSSFYCDIMTAHESKSEKLLQFYETEKSRLNA